MSDLSARLRAAIEKLGKWRALYAGWWFGTRSLKDGQARAARDNFDRTIMLRCEVNALTALLIAKGVFTPEEFQGQLLDDVEHLDRELEKRWDGIRTTPDGLEFFDLIRSQRTMTSDGFPP